MPEAFAGARPGLPRAWRRYGRLLAPAGIGYLVIAGMGRLAYALPHLLHDVETWSAVDLKYRYGEVAAWFAGTPVYGVVDGAVYPPASHAILWPFLGWLPLDGARALWAVTTLAAAAALAALAYRVCAPARRRDRLLIAGLAFAAYPLQQSIFVGQLGVHVVAFAAWGAHLAFSARRRAWSDVLAGLLLAACLVKPTLSLPLVAGALIAAGRVRPAVFTAAAYAVLTLIAAAAQPAGLIQLFEDWLAIANVRVPFADGVPNLHMLLAALDLRSWMTPASLLVLGVTAMWMGWRRNADPWLLMGVAGVVARIWAHSTAYDDMFLLFPVIALFRTTHALQGRARTAAALVLAAAWLALLTPTWAFYDLATGIVWLIHGLHTTLWLIALGLLARFAGATSRARPAPL